MKSTLRVIAITVIVSAMLMMAVLTVAAEVTGNQALTLVALPGLWVSLFITGGHGGTRFMEACGNVVAVLVNISLLGAPLALLLLVVPKGHNNQKGRRTSA
jgi:hypothetical protein